MAAVEESPAQISASEFRQAMGHFATGVTVVTSIDEDGEPVGTTASAVSSLSLNPPLVLVCFDLGSLTLRAIRGHGAFVVNVLAAPQQHLSANFARRGLAAAWDGVRHRPGPTGSPRLEGVLAALECTVENSLPGGITRSSSAACTTSRSATTTPRPCCTGAAPTCRRVPGVSSSYRRPFRPGWRWSRPGSTVSSQRRWASLSRVCGARTRSVRPASA